MFHRYTYTNLWISLNFACYSCALFSSASKGTSHGLTIFPGSIAFPLHGDNNRGSNCKITMAQMVYISITMSNSPVAGFKALLSPCHPRLDS